LSTTAYQNPQFCGRGNESAHHTDIKSGKMFTVESALFTDELKSNLGSSELADKFSFEVVKNIGMNSSAPLRKDA
jgi:hypothetical protein